jgi:hypothetical protein
LFDLLFKAFIFEGNEVWQQAETIVISNLLDFLIRKRMTRKKPIVWNKKNAISLIVECVKVKLLETNPALKIQSLALKFGFELFSLQEKYMRLINESF